MSMGQWGMGNCTMGNKGWGNGGIGNRKWVWVIGTGVHGEDNGEWVDGIILISQSKNMFCVNFCPLATYLI